MKIGYNVVISTSWGDVDGFGENVITYEKEEDAKFWAYVISAFYRFPDKNMKEDFKKFLEAVSAPVALPSDYVDRDKKYSIISEVISAAIINLDYVPEGFKKSFLKEKLEGVEHDMCSDIFCEYIGTTCDGEMDNTIDGIKIVYIGELRAISF